MTLPEMVPQGEPLEVEGLFNPLLLASGVTPKPCDLRVGPGAIVLVTGPNSGGKTRLLQAIAIAQLLAEGGFFAPARAGRLPRASGLFASLFEEARADQPEGHLGMELLRIRRCFDELDAGALVVLDELCSGTNPSEGEEIAAPRPLSPSGAGRSRLRDDPPPQVRGSPRARSWRVPRVPAGGARRAGAAYISLHAGSRAYVACPQDRRAPRRDSRRAPPANQSEEQDSDLVFRRFSYPSRAARRRRRLRLPRSP